MTRAGIASVMLLKTIVTGLLVVGLIYGLRGFGV
jgi:hypothetical protein